MPLAIASTAAFGDASTAGIPCSGAALAASSREIEIRANWARASCSTPSTNGVNLNFQAVRAASAAARCRNS